MSKVSQNIFLIGPMGSGKSTIANIMAKKLNREFRDSDHFIEKRTGVDIARIFDVEGETGFRDRETQALKTLLNQNNQVIATGGGSVLREENQGLLRSKGYIVFLDTSVNQQLHRLRRDKKRPLLQTENPRQQLESLFKTRHPIYQNLAGLVGTDAQGRIGVIVGRAVNIPSLRLAAAAAPSTSEPCATWLRCQPQPTAGNRPAERAKSPGASTP